MKNILLLLIIISFQISAQHVNVKFIVTAPVNDSSSIYIAGNHTQIGNWQPDNAVLVKTSGSTWEKEFQLPVNFILEYKFTRGSWANEAVNVEGKIPSNYSLSISNDTVIYHTLENWKDNFEYALSGQITGTVEYHYELKGDGIRPRNIIVWLPPDYFLNEDKFYPVLYMQDGQNIFDPSTSTFGYDWQIDETADSLIRINEIEEIIVVGIYNTPSRTKEYTPTDSGRAYMNFIVHNLKPFIDSAYRTKPGREDCAAMGSSAGGLISFMLLWEYHELFSKAACLSPAFHIEHINYIPFVENADAKKPVKIYIDNGGLGIDKKLQPGIDEMITALENKGYKLDEDLVWQLFKDAEHSEKDWSKRAAIPLKFLFGK